MATARIVRACSLVELKRAGPALRSWSLFQGEDRLDRLESGGGAIRSFSLGRGGRLSPPRVGGGVGDGEASFSSSPFQTVRAAEQ